MCFCEAAPMPAIVSSAVLSTLLPSVLILWATSCCAAVFKRILQRLVEHDALLGIDGQLVDQRVLRGDLVVERIDEGLEHRGVALQRLAFGQQLLLLGLLLVVFGGELGAIAFELRALLWLVEAAILFSMSSSSGFSSSIRFCTAVRLVIVTLRRSMTCPRLASDVL